MLRNFVLGLINYLRGETLLKRFYIYLLLGIGIVLSIPSHTIAGTINNCSLASGAIDETSSVSPNADIYQCQDDNTYIPLALLGIPFIYSKRAKKRKAWEEEREKIKDE